MMKKGTMNQNLLKYLSLLLVCCILLSNMGTLNVAAEENSTEVYSAVSTIVTGNDDMEQKEDGSLDLSSSDIELVWEKESSRPQTVGLRFEDLHIPAGSTIESAYIQFTVDEDKNYGTPAIAIDVVDDVNVASFGTSDNALTNLSTLGQPVSWTNIEAWTVENDATEAQRTSDVSALVQGIVNKSGWETDNAIAFILTGVGTRTAVSYEKGGESKAAKLVVTYTNPNGPAEEIVEPPKEYDASSISFTLGSDETSLNFVWYSNKTTSGATTAIVDVAKAEDVTGEEFPEASKIRFTGSCTAVSDTSLIDVNTNKVTVTGLEENTEYVYRVGDGVDFSECYSFTTGNADDYSFFVVGDPQIGSSGVEANTIGWNDTLEKAVAAFEDTDFIVSAGDQVNNSNSEAEYEGFFSPDELRELPLVTVQGNHDNSSKYLDHFNCPDMSDTLGTTSAGGDYSFVYGDTLFIGLNSNNTSGATHQAFVEEAVAANSDVKWKVVIFHHAIYSSASHSTQSSIVGRRQELFPVFDNADIDLVLMGHDHCYTRSYQMEGDMPLVDQDTDASGAVINPDGTLYITCNSGSGSKYYTMKSTPEEYAAVREQLRVPTFSRVEVDEDSFTISTYRTDTMEMTDTYTVIKDENYINPDNVRTTVSKIQNSLDDIEEYNDGTLDYNSSDLELVWERENSDQQIVGVRFEELNIPAGASIVDAYIQFTVDEPRKNYGETDLSIQVFDSANVQGFANELYTVSSKQTTTNFVKWTDIPEWTEAHDAGVNQRTPDLSVLVQEIVDKEDWDKGNAIGFVISGNGTRSAESFDGEGSAMAPQLVVQYVIEDNGTGTMSVEETEVIDEETETLDYYFSMLEAENINAIDITFEYDETLVAFEGIQAIGMDDVVMETSVEDGKIHVVAGFITPLTTTVDAIDMFKLEFSLLQEVTEEVTVSVSVVEAYSAAAGINDAVETNIEESEAEITITSYKILCDVNGDNVLSINDLSLALEYYRCSNADADWDKAMIADVNRDGVIDLTDFSLIAHYIIQ